MLLLLMSFTVFIQPFISIYILRLAFQLFYCAPSTCIRSCKINMIIQSRVPNQAKQTIPCGLCFFFFFFVYFALHCTKNHIFFFQIFRKMVFPKKSHWNMIFLALSGKMIFLFPENMILFFRHKRKDDLSQKNTWKYDIFFKCSEKMVFPKNSRLNMIFFVISGKMVFLFSRKYDIFSLGGK